MKPKFNFSKMEKCFTSKGNEDEQRMSDVPESSIKTCSLPLYKAFNCLKTMPALPNKSHTRNIFITY